MIKQTDAKMFIIGVLLFLSGTSALAGDDIDKHRSCAFCGMDRKAYGYSRMLIQYEDGGSAGVCSLHCAVIELDANKVRAVKALFVADRDSRLLIDAEKAVWVMGGKKPGVMTQRPKWAFASPTGAGAFIDTYGGKIVTWSEAFAAAREEVSQERR
jgi:copper chaperone NosL